MNNDGCFFSVLVTMIFAKQMKECFIYSTTTDHTNQNAGAIFFYNKFGLLSIYSFNQKRMSSCWPGNCLEKPCLDKPLSIFKIRKSVCVVISRSFSFMGYWLDSRKRQVCVMRNNRCEVSRQTFLLKLNHNPVWTQLLCPIYLNFTD